MNIKSLLIGSAAALAAVSGAQAADAIVAAEPEPLEYVRVCDAFGTGFFYIPGTETCLKFGGYVRFQVNVQRNNNSNVGTSAGGNSDWDAFTRAQFEVDTRTDTELGALRGFIGLRGNADNGSSSSSSVFVDQAFIEVAGLKVGKFYSWWDDGLSGETDVLSTNALFNSIRYTYDAGSFAVGVSVDELEGLGGSFRGGFFTPAGVFTGFAPAEPDNNVGIAANVSAKFGGVNFALLGGYDVDQEEGAIRAILTADIGPGTFGLAGVYATGLNAYYAASEWAVAAEYAIKATDKLTITPGAQYFGNIADTRSVTAAGVTTTAALTNDWSSNDAWQAGLTVDYKITQGLSTKIAVNYFDSDASSRDEVNGFVRLQRSF